MSDSYKHLPFLAAQEYSTNLPLLLVFKPLESCSCTQNLYLGHKNTASDRSVCSRHYSPLLGSFMRAGSIPTVCLFSGTVKRCFTAMLTHWTHCSSQWYMPETEGHSRRSHYEFETMKGEMCNQYRRHKYSSSSFVSYGCTGMFACSVY